MKNRMFTPINAAEIFNKVMTKHSLPVRAAATDFVFADKCVLLGMSFDGERLANTLFDQLFPRSPAGIYHHYTSYGGFKGIVSSGSLRLYNLHKRFASGEFRTFCRDHGLDGYLRTGAGGSEVGYFAALMTDLFYTSLVDAKAADSDLHWERFADRHRGVRLTLRISLAPKYPNFRAVTYQQPDCVPAFKDLKAAFNSEGLNFVNSGLCRMPGFYQRQDFSSQFEHRLLAKRFPGVPKEFPFSVRDEGNGSIKFIESDLTTNGHPWFNIKLLGATVGRSGSLQNVVNYLKSYSKFPNLPAASVS